MLNDRDTFSRRQLLRVGGLGAFGLHLAGLLRAEATQPSSTSRLRSCVVVFFYGGPSQLDTWDPKPNAPVEVRGEFRTTATSVPGIRVGEHLPHCARVMHKMALVRTLHHPMRNHNSAAVEALCGRTPTAGDGELLADNANSFPCYGSIIRQRMPQTRGVPGHIALPHVMYNVVKLPGQGAGFLGSDFGPIQISGDPNQARFRVDELELPADLPLARLEHRQSLLGSIDRQRALAQRSGAERSLNVYQAQALDLLHSPRVRDAFDICNEDSRLRERYGRNRLGQSLLLARRLVEAGVRVVNVNDKISNGQLENWDSHENNFGRLKNDLLPPADRALATFIDDLDARGLLESTLVIALAEFGRTPLVNRNAGRDHWPDCFSIVLAGGGVRGGAVHGTSDRFAAYPNTDPVTPGDLAATLFWRFGLDHEAEMRDLTGRPYRIAEGEPLRALFA